MTAMRPPPRLLHTIRAAILLCLVTAAGQAPLAQQPPYYPPPGAWARKDPAALGLDRVKLAEAIAFAESHETTRAIDFSDQQQTFGTLLGSMPTRRARTNGLVVYKGFIVAEFGDTTWVDPTYSAAKSMLATVAGTSPSAPS
jgi:hypothetical protein